MRFLIWANGLLEGIVRVTMAVWSFDSDQLGFMPLFMGLFGGAWSASSVLAAFQYRCDNIMRDQLRAEGLPATATVVGKESRRVRSGKHSRAARFLHVTFPIDEFHVVAEHGPVTVSCEIEVAGDVYEDTDEGSEWPMVYLGTDPLRCHTSPVPELSRLESALEVGCTASCSLVGVLFLLLLTGHSGFALLCYRCVPVLKNASHSKCSAASNS